MQTTACKIFLDGQRLAVVVEGRKWAKVTTFSGSFKILRSGLADLHMEALDEPTADKLLRRLGLDGEQAVDPDDSTDDEGGSSDAR